MLTKTGVIEVGTGVMISPGKTIEQVAPEVLVAADGARKTTPGRVTNADAADVAELVGVIETTDGLVTSAEAVEDADAVGVSAAAAGVVIVHVALEDETAEGLTATCGMTDPNMAVPTDPRVPPTPVKVIDIPAPTIGAVTTANALLIAALDGVNDTPKVRITPAVSHSAGDPVVQTAGIGPAGGLIQ